MTAISGSDERCIGLIGLGLVGAALAKRFLAAGFHVIGFDLNEDRRREAEAKGVRIVSTSTIAAKEAPRIVLSLPDSNVVKDVILHEEGILSSAPHVSIIDTTTGDPSHCEEIAQRIEEAGGTYIDACIIGSSTHVAKGGSDCLRRGDEGGSRSMPGYFGHILETGIPYGRRWERQSGQVGCKFSFGTKSIRVERRAVVSGRVEYRPASNFGIAQIRCLLFPRDGYQRPQNHQPRLSTGSAAVAASERCGSYSSAGTNDGCAFISFATAPYHASDGCFIGLGRVG